MRERFVGIYRKELGSWSREKTRRGLNRKKRNSMLCGLRASHENGFVC